MKPNFALSLSNEGAELLHRVVGGWQPVGTVGFDRADRDAALEALLAEARRLAPDGMATKLIVPESEIRYATVLAPGPTDEARRYQIEAEIEGLTPYPIEDLAYDWSVEDDHALVAVVARETLIEVEEFAVERGFNPVSFVAQPPRGAFLGEPFFGQTGLAQDFLGPGEMVQPDAEPVLRLSRPARAPQSDAPKPDAPKPVTKADAVSGAAKPERPASPASMVRGSETKPLPGDLVRRLGTRLRREHAAEEASSGNAFAAVRDSGRDAASKPSGGAGGMAVVSSAAAAVAAFVPSLRGKSGDGARGAASAAVARDEPSPEAETLPASMPQAVSPDLARAEPVESSPSEAAVIAFASRRKPAVTPPDPVGASSGRAGGTAPGGRLAITRRDAKTDQGGRVQSLGSAGRRMVRSTLDRLSLLGPARRALGRDMPSADEAERKRQKKAKKAGRDAKPTLALAEQGGRPVGPEVVIPESRPPLTQREKVSEAESLTLFGRRGMPEPEPFLPYRTLIAIGAVIVLLVAVAVWAVFLNRMDTAPAGVAQLPAGSVTQPQPGLSAAPDRGAAPEPAAPAASDPAVTEAVPDALVSVPVDSAPAPVEAPLDSTPVATGVAVLPEETAPGETLPGTEPVASATAPIDTEALLDSLVQDALSEAEPTEVLEGLTAGDGQGADEPMTEADIGQSAGTGAEVGSVPSGAEEVPSSVDTPRATASIRLALPGRLDVPPVEERAPAALPTPPPFDQVLAGVATDVAPEIAAGSDPEIEVNVTAGRPSSVPAPRPTSIAPLPPAEPEAAAVPEAVTEAPSETVAELVAEAEPVIADDTPRADPALAGARPEPRSARVQALGAALRAAQPDIEEATEPANRLDQGSLQPELTPMLRPASLVVQAAATVPAAPTPAEQGPTARATEPATAPPPGGLDLALLRPLRRPTDLVPEPSEADLAEDVGTIDDEDTSAEAVATSLLPNTRPQNFDRQVAAALAVRGADRVRAVVPADAAPAPAASAAPSIPTTASVQREATERRAIRTRQANLIGVFGTATNRRALVRMSNGRVVRLQVGDNFDGGRVSAIGENELRYVRGGRNQVLRIAG